MKLPITVQDLIDLCAKNRVEPSEMALLLREPCGTGDDQLDFLLNPQFKCDGEALNLEDEHQKVPFAITLDHADTHFDWDGA